MSTETFAYDNLIAGSQKPIVQRPGTARLGQSWSRGELIGQLTATLKWQTVDFGAYASFSDVGIAVEAVDSTEGEVNTTIYVEGEFNENEVIIGYSDDADDWRETLAGHGIYLREALTTEGV
jgi:hypothetical protein